MKNAVLKIITLAISLNSISLVCYSAEEDKGNTQHSLWRIIYKSNEYLQKVPFKILEEMYGAKLIIADGDNPPKNPKKVEGTVLHQKTGDDAYFTSKTGQNPGLASDQLFKELARIGRDDFGFGKKFGGEWEEKGDDKVDEYLMLKKVAPNVAPPDSINLSEFKMAPISANELAEIKVEVAKTMKKIGLTSHSAEQKLIKAESIRRSINQKMGPTILKEHASMGGSEGKLPRTSQDWLTPYAEWLKDSDKNVWIGGVTDVIVNHPEDIIAQKLVDIKHEMRVHIVKGKILEDGVFLRMYHLNEYLTNEDKRIVKEALEKDLLGALRQKFGSKFDEISITPDVALTKDGKVNILDFNIGMESGYYRPWEDMITANRLAEALTGKKTPLLIRWEAMLNLPMGSEKAKAIKSFFNRYQEFYKGDVKEAYWDRIIDNYIEKVSTKPNSEIFAKGLQDFWDSGLRSPEIYLQYLNKGHDQMQLSLSDAEQTVWNRRLNGMEHSFDIESKNGIFQGREKPKSNSCDKSILKVAAGTN